jgi:hypothetical protein
VRLPFRSDFMRAGGTVSGPAMMMLADYSLYAVILANIWLGTSFNMILLSVGLSGIAKDLYEAAELDGANALQRFFTITLPMMRATIGAITPLSLVEHSRDVARVAPVIPRAMRRLSPDAPALGGVVRLSATDGFSGFIAAPAMAALRAEHPEVSLEIVAATRRAAQQRVGVDLEVVVGRPHVQRAEAIHLGDYVLGLYASRGFLRRRGMPESVEKLAGEPLVYFIEAMLQVDALDEARRSTRGMVDATFLAALPEGAVVVNAGRGRIVDTEALVEELRNGRLRAALDVTDPEPLPEDHPLWDCPGTIISPHMARTVPGTNALCYAVAADQIRALIAGKRPPNLVSRTPG